MAGKYDGLLDQDVAGTIKKDLAVSFFQRYILSFGQAREFSGLSVWNFMDTLRERQMPLDYSETEYMQDSHTIKELL